ncbi:hypothetical protein PSA7680_01079 [Pseudoruegeria aquimaris]|uniref:Translocase n=1 Tax=Pseudoruegeria aquimaris TaxID=393663 RepID=A0A1Y5RTE9_9RHOB|nr:hypothetical protein [Pseudoruegeria aquimaris]SLN25036.1 hypothetical protein PSA7680_01079 [Pseudoruegeria aquimaris]
MASQRRYSLIASATVLTALLAMGVMQSDAIASRFVTASAPQGATPAHQPVETAHGGALSVPRDPEASVVFGAAPLRAPALPEGSAEPDARRTAQPVLSAFGLPCTPRLAAAPAPGGMVAVQLSAPCEPERFFTLTQGDLAFTDMTSVTGDFAVTLPALSQDVALDVRFEDGSRLSTALRVEDAALFDHVILQWQGEAGLSIHALEFGARYGEKGHVSAASPRDPSFAARALGGFITELGARDLNHTRRAEIYSFPSGLMGRSGLVRLSVEAEVTPANCGQDLAARSTQIRAGAAEPSVEIALAMPDCSAVGDYLVLKNLLRDLKIARN